MSTQQIIQTRNGVIFIDKTNPNVSQHTLPIGIVELLRASFNDDGCLYPAVDIYVSFDATEAQELAALFSKLARKLAKVEA